MELAINYSPQAAKLLSAGRIQLDYFKCPGQPDLVAEAGTYTQVVVHFNLDAGPGELQDADWEVTTRLIDQTKTPFVNLHLAPYSSDFPGIAPDNPTQAQTTQIVKRMLEDLEVAIDRFGAERVIVENIPYRGANGVTLRPGVDPEIIGQIIAEADCGFLLDISHARIAAHHLGESEHNYMDRLPCHRLKELHFTGLHSINGRLQDHLPILESDWPALKWVLERIRSGDWARPWLLTFEYGGVGEKYATRSDPTVIAEQVPRLKELIGRL
jgi:uncharacterized protein (UPF0276 family)